MSSPVPFQDAEAKILAANLGVPISWPNTNVKPPHPPGPWLAVDITSYVLEPIELSGGAWQEEGTLFIDVIVPKGTGSIAARTLAKTVSNIFRGHYDGPVIYTGGSIGNGTVSQNDGMWWIIPVTVTWRYQDTT